MCGSISTSPTKRLIGRFHSVVVQWTSKKYTKKRDARAELLSWSLNLLFFEVDRDHVASKQRILRKAEFNQPTYGTGHPQQGWTSKMYSLLKKQGYHQYEHGTVYSTG